jgi:two-component system response regulator YesN
MPEQLRKILNAEIQRLFPFSHPPVHNEVNMPGLLVVDDTALIRTTIIKIIARENIDISPVVEAENGEEAVRAALQHQPDIVFMDIKMPGMNGLQATALIRKALPHSKVVMLTAYDEFSYVQEALKLGAVDYLLKPVRPEKLVEVLANIQAIIREEHEQSLALRETQHRLEEALPLIEANLVDTLIYRQTPDELSIEKALQQLNKTVTMPVVMVIGLDDFDKLIKRQSPEKIQEQYTVIAALVRKIMQEKTTALIGQWQLGQLIVILSAEAALSSAKALKSLGEEIRQRIIRGFHLEVAVSFGGRCDSLEAIAVSYAEARMTQRQVKSDHPVLHIDDAGELNYPQGHRYPLTLEKELLDQVRLKEEEVCLGLMNELVDNLVYKYKDSPHVLYSYFAELLTLLSRTVIEMGASAPEVFDLSHRYMAVLFTSPSPAQLRAWALNGLAEILATVEAKPLHPNKDAVQLAIEHIHREYQNPDISLSEVAREVGLSSSHLGYLLKDRVGLSYSQYLTSLRVKYAKKLLQTTPMTISAIAEAVGYPNPTNFYRIFQRETGLTPNAYRQSKTG